MVLIAYQSVVCPNRLEGGRGRVREGRKEEGEDFEEEVEEEMRDYFPSHFDVEVAM